MEFYTTSQTGKIRFDSYSQILDCINIYGLYGYIKIYKEGKEYNGIAIRYCEPNKFKNELKEGFINQLLLYNTYNDMIDTPLERWVRFDHGGMNYRGYYGVVTRISKLEGYKPYIRGKIQINY